jgi:hypothetical protein
MYGNGVHPYLGDVVISEQGFSIVDTHEPAIAILLLPI